MMDFILNRSIHSKLKIGSIVIFLSFMSLVMVTILYYKSIDNYSKIEELNSKEIKSNMSNILKINNKTSIILEDTATLLDKNANSLEFFEFIGSINKQLVSLLIEPTQKQVTLVANMIKGWNEKSIKNNPFLSKYYKDIDKNLKELENSYDTTIIKNLQNLFDKIYSDLIDKAYNSSDNISAKVDNLKQKLNSSEEKINSNLTILKNIQNAREETKTISKIVLVGFFISLLFVVISLWFFAYITEEFNKDLKVFQNGLKNFFDYINDSDKTIEPIKLDKKDEISLMAQEINRNILNIKSNLEKDYQMIQEVTLVSNKVKDGYLNVKIEKVAHNKSLNRLKDVVNEMLENLYQNISNILSVLNQYSKYNYKPNVNIDTSGEIKELANEINNLKKAIVQMLKENSQNSITLQKDANTLLKNVEELNNNSDLTIKSLEKTMENLKNITQNTTNSTKTISKMADFSIELKKSVKNGELLADKTIKSMENINNEVNFINEVISVIDSIAFQTNILSLNAAVEAATAGEYGKGFAVVAQEVRNLAQKSTEASSQIKETVEKAIKKAEEGGNITKSMMIGYKNLIEKIEQTLKLIDDTKNISSEQLKNIEDIDSTISILNKHTNKNVQIAKNTKEIALKTDSLSKVIVKSLEEKVF